MEDADKPRKDPGIEALPLSAKTSDGLDEWNRWIEVCCVDGVVLGDQVIVDVDFAPSTMDEAAGIRNPSLFPELGEARAATA